MAVDICGELVSVWAGFENGLVVLQDFSPHLIQLLLHGKHLQMYLYCCNDIYLSGGNTVILVVQ